MSNQPLVGGTRTVQVLADEGTLARVAADAFVRYAQEAIVTRGRAAVALAGGTSVQPMYRLLGGPPHTTRLDFGAVHFFFADERCVAPDHPQSNFRTVDELLFRPVGVGGRNVHRIRGELPPPAAAADYEKRLRSFFDLVGQGQPGQWPRFDLIVLGMGGDGHVASLFSGPGEGLPELAWTAATVSPEGVRDRVTLTWPVINAARQIVMVVSGSAKAEAVAAVLTGRQRLPAWWIAPAAGRVSWLLDAAAASERIFTTENTESTEKTR